MPDLATLTIQINAAAEQAQQTLDSLIGSLHALAAACAQTLRVDLDPAPLGASAQAAQDLARDLAAASSALGGAQAASAAAARQAQGFSGALDAQSASARDAEGRARALLSAYRSLESRTNALDRRADALARAQKAVTSAMDRGERSVSGAGREVRDFAGELGYAGDSLDGLRALVPAAADTLRSQLASAQSSAQSLAARLAEAAANADISASVRVDCSAAIGALSGLIAAAQAAQAVLAALGTVSGGGSTASSTTVRRVGGGGGGRSSAEDEAEAARRAAEEAERRRREALEADYRRIEHRRRMNEISFEEELAQLEALRARHRMNAEEIMEWEEKVYELKQEIRQRDIDSLDTLSQGIVTALENRCEAMLEAEQRRLDESRSTWEKWRDDSVAAVEAQIAALDRLAETEDREKDDAEELRAIAKLQQQIAYEQDAYNRAQLENQLAQAVAAREERLRRLALEDRKDALRAEIDEIEQKTGTQLDALDREQQALEDAYAERLKSAALQAEAEKLILAGSQREMLDLLSAYAPDYEAAGRTLGERLLEGFTAKAGDVADWFERFNAQLTQARSRLTQTAQAAADRFCEDRAPSGASAPAAVTVHQTVAFNQPVETPAQVARRMAEVNEALAQML